MKLIAGIVIGMLLGIGAAWYWQWNQKAEIRAQKTEAIKPISPKVLYYRNPMGLPDTSPVPKKDEMGMDYIAVYQDEHDAQDDTSFDASGQVNIGVEKVQKLGVKTEHVGKRVLDRTIRVAGRVEVNERNVHNIAPKFEGWIEKLHVKTTGEPVKKGQALFDAYSPELVSAQREYAIAMQGVAALKDADNDTRQGMKRLAESSLQRLKNWDISAQQIKALTESGTAKHSMTFHAFHTPVNGIVMEKKALEGMRFLPGEMLYQIADLSSVWVMADIFEQDIAKVRSGARAKVKINAYPDKEFTGTISYIYPTLRPETRTVTVRLELENPHGLLKPAMFAQVEISVSGKGRVLTVPT